MAKVIEINDIDSLGPYRMAWSALYAQTPGATFFQTFDWLSIYWRHFGQHARLKVLVVRAAREVIGIVPLCVKRQRHKLGSLRTLCYPLDGWAPCFGPLGPNPAATLALAMKHLATSHRDWDRIELDYVDQDVQDRGRTARAMELAGLSPRVEPSESTSVIDLPNRWDEYLGALSRKTRHEVRRHVRRVLEAGDVRHIRHRPRPLREGDGDPRWDLFDQCTQVAQASWQAVSANGNTLCHPFYRDFYRDTHAAAARLGMLDMNVLTIAGRPVAFNYNYVTQQRITGLRMGFDPSAQPPKGVGLSLLAMILRDSVRRGDVSIDLGVGGQQFKARLRTGVRNVARVCHTPRGAWRSQALRFGQWLRRDSRAERSA